MGNPLGINIKLKLDDNEIKQNLEQLKNTPINLSIMNFTQVNDNFKTLVGYMNQLKEIQNVNPFNSVQIGDLKEVVTLLKEVNTLNKGIKINVVSNAEGITSKNIKGQLSNEEQVMKEFANKIGLSFTKELQSTIKKALQDEGSLEEIVNAKIFKEDKDYGKKMSEGLLKQYEDAIGYLKGKTFHVSPIDFDKTEIKTIEEAFKGKGLPNIDKNITRNLFSTTGFDEIQKEFMHLYGSLIPSNKEITTVQGFGLALVDVVNRYKELKEGIAKNGVGLNVEEEAKRQARTWSDVANAFEDMQEKIKARENIKDSLKNISSINVEAEGIKEENEELDKQNEKLEKKHNLVRASERKSYVNPKLDLVKKTYDYDDEGTRSKDPSEVVTKWTAISGAVYQNTKKVDKVTGDLVDKTDIVVNNYEKQRKELEKIESFKLGKQNDINNLASNGILPKEVLDKLQNSLDGLDKNSSEKDKQKVINQYNNIIKLEKQLKKEIEDRKRLQESAYEENDKLEAYKSKKLNQVNKLYSNDILPKDKIAELEKAINSLEIGYSKKDEQNIVNVYDNLIGKEKELKAQKAENNRVYKADITAQLKQQEARIKKEEDYNDWWLKSLKDKTEAERKSNESLVSRTQKTQGNKLDDLSINFKGFYDTKEIEEFRKELDSLSPTSETLTEDINKLNNKIKEFKNELSGREKISKLGTDISDLNTGVNTKSSEEDIKKLVSEIGGINAEIKQIDSEPIIQNGNEVRKVTYKVKEGNDKWHEYQIAIVQAGATGETSLKKLDKGLKDVINREVSFTQRIKNAWMAVASFAGVTSVFYNIVHGFKNGVNSVIELDTAMVGLKKVTDETEETYNNFATTANKMAIAVGHSTKSAIESTAEFAKLGYTLKDSAKLAQEALIYSNIGDIDIADATQSITATMKGFNLTANDTRHILDALNEVGNNYAISTGGIGDALQRSASALNEANNSFEESVGLITAGNASVQDTEKVGNALFGGLVV